MLGRVALVWNATRAARLRGTCLGSHFLCSSSLKSRSDIRRVPDSMKYPWPAARILSAASIFSARSMSLRLLSMASATASDAQQAIWLCHHPLCGTVVLQPVSRHIYEDNNANRSRFIMTKNSYRFSVWSQDLLQPSGRICVELSPLHSSAESGIEKWHTPIGQRQSLRPRTKDLAAGDGCDARV